MLKIKTLPDEFLKTETDLIVVSFFKDVIPLKGDAGNIDWFLNGQISNLIKKMKVFDFGISVCIKGVSDSEYDRISGDMVEGILKGFSKIQLSESDWTVKIAEEDKRRFLMLNRLMKHSVETFKERHQIVLEG